jgi:hypothetical protein
MAVVPMLPPAPTLFTTTTGCPSAADSSCAISRVSTSAALPAASGATMVMGLDG